MLRKLAFVGGLTTLLAAGVAVAGTPFGGDDMGTISSSKAVTKCENGVSKAVGKLTAAILKCHASEATGKLANDAAEDTCEGTALTKFGATKTAGCDACTNIPSLGTTVAALIDANNNKVYCSAGTPFGGDDSGNISATPAIIKCENGVGKSVGKLVAAIAKCHSSEASGKGDDETCEGTALTKFGTTKTAGCDTCTTTQSITSGCSAHPNGTGLTGLGNFVACTLDGANNLVYCGSPSGAFLN